MVYGVIICTKCRKNAQIIEVGSSKTTRCQRCNATLMTRKLRLFFSSDSLEEAISVRTQIQARIAEKGTYDLQSQKNDSIPGYQVFGSEIDERSACFIDNRKERKKKKTDEIILDILRSADKQMPYEELKNRAIALDIDEEKFDDVLGKMLQAGEIYSPSKNVFRIV